MMQGNCSEIKEASILERRSVTRIEVEGGEEIHQHGEALAAELK